MGVDETHKECSDGEELLECLTVDGGNLQQTQDNHVPDHRPFATVSASCQNASFPSMSVR
jgi:hypothetical protein